MSRFNAELLLLLCAICWSVAYFNVDVTTHELDPMLAVTYRYMIASLIMLPFVFSKKLFDKRELFYGSVLGVILGAALTLITFALTLAPLQNSGFLVGSFVVIVPIIVWLKDGQWLSKVDQFALLLALVGIWTITGGISELQTGDFLYLCAAFVSAVHIVYVTDFSRRGTDPITNTFIQCFVISALGVVIQFFRGIPFVAPSVSTSLHLLFLGSIASGLCLWLQLMAQRHTSPWRASLIYSIEPLIVLLVAYFLSGESLSMITLLGGAFIFLALFVSSIGLKETSRSISR